MYAETYETVSLNTIFTSEFSIKKSCGRSGPLYMSPKLKIRGVQKMYGQVAQCLFLFSHTFISCQTSNVIYLANKKDPNYVFLLSNC